MALGASPFDVLQMVTLQSLALALPGLLLGIAGALLGFRFFGSMLIGVSPADPLTFLVVFARIAIGRPFRD